MAALRRWRILNNGTRHDDHGQPVNAHQGSMLQDSSGRYWLFGDWLRSCEATIQCHCVGDDMDSWTQDNGVGIYSTLDFVHWRYEAGPILDGFNQPRAAFFPATGKYHMYIQFPLRLATSSSPGGPWLLEDGPVYSSACRKGQCGDIGVFVDDDATAYLIVSGKDNLVRVQRLSEDGRRGDGPASPPFGPKGEAPVLFRRGSRVHAIFGHNCWCCKEGAEAFAWVADNPLGPWVGGEDINNGCELNPHAPASPRAPLQPRTVTGQTAFAISIGGGPPGSSQADARRHYLAFDLWMTGATRDAQYLHFAPLDFAADGRILPLAGPSCLVDEVPPPHLPPPAAPLPRQPAPRSTPPPAPNSPGPETASATPPPSDPPFAASAAFVIMLFAVGTSVIFATRSRWSTRTRCCPAVVHTLCAREPDGERGSHGCCDADSTEVACELIFPEQDTVSPIDDQQSMPGEHGRSSQ